MVTETTIDQLQTELAELQSTAAGTARAVEQAQKAFDKSDGKSFEERLGLHEAVKTATGASVKAGNAVKAVEKRIAGFAFEREAATRAAATESIEADAQRLTTQFANVLNGLAGVDGVVVTYDYTTASPTVSIKLTGLATKTVRTSSGNGVGRSRKGFSVNGTVMTARQVCEQYNPEVLDRKVGSFSVTREAEAALNRAQVPFSIVDAP